MDIGIKIKQLRLKCALTQSELADRCELTKGYISQLENDLTSPSITSLMDILSALGTNLQNFFKDEKEEQVVFTSEHFFSKNTEEQKITWLVPNSQKNAMEPIELIIASGFKLTADMPHEGEEFGYVIEGEILLHLGEKSYTVKSGESFYYVCNKVHYLENIKNTGAKILWVSSPPTF